MMNLFDILPNNYFSLFTNKNKKIYIDSLLTLYTLLQNDEVIIKKSDFINALKQKEKNLSSFSLDAEELDEEEKNDLSFDSVSSKAAFVVRRLEESGWIDISMDIETNEEIVVLAPYTISMLKTFSNIISDEEAPYISLVHSTYSELKLEDEEIDDLLYPTLLRCYDNTKRLKVELITITHSIRIFQNRLAKLFDTNEVLHSYFDVYKNKIYDRYYHPLKTFDSVAKYKRPIIKILDRWLKNKEIREKLILQASISSKSNNKSEIESEIITKINFISDTYETLNKLISSIDRENNLYTKSSTQKILYLNNTDRSIKGHLENIFKHYAASIKDNKSLVKVLNSMQDSLTFFEQGYMDSSSITLPILKKYKEEGIPMEVFNFDEEDLTMNSFYEEAKNVYTDERVYDFMAKSFGDKEKIDSKSLKLNDFDALICLILATVKSDDETSFYSINDLNEPKEVVNNEFLIPNFEFVKKKEEKKEND